MNRSSVAPDRSEQSQDSLAAATDGTATAEDVSASDQDPSGAEDRRAARQLYRESVADGAPINQLGLGKRFDRSRSWAKARMSEVQAAWEDELAEGLKGQTSHDPSVAIADGDDHCRRARPVPAEARVVVWIALLLGIAVSIAANVMHAQQETDVIAAWVGSAFWPVALLLALEIVTRVPWPRRSPWYATARFAGIGLVALVAAIQSYRHMAELLLLWGEDQFSAYLGPLAVDGLMIVAASALLAVQNPRGST